MAESPFYAPTPPALLVKNANGDSVVIVLPNVTAVEPWLGSGAVKSIVRLVSGQIIQLGITVDEFWEMI